jgi:hypothetical protein
VTGGGTQNLNTTLSKIFWGENVAAAQDAVNQTNGSPSNVLLGAIGEGIENNAAHEVAHQLSNEYLGSGKVIGAMGLDDESSDTYNSIFCDAPWIFTGVGTSATGTNGVPIHWEEANADRSLANILGRRE